MKLIHDFRRTYQIRSLFVIHYKVNYIGRLNLKRYHERRSFFNENITTSEMEVLQLRVNVPSWVILQ